MNIIICDDEYYVRKALSKCIHTAFEKNGIADINLLECASAEEAMDKINHIPVDIIFTDIQMGKLNGVDLCSQIAREHPEIKTVIISGHADFEYAQKAIAARVNRYLLKPVDEEELFYMVESLIASVNTEDPSSMSSHNNEAGQFCFIEDVALKSRECYAVILLKTSSSTIDPAVFSKLQETFSAKEPGIRLVKREDARTVLLLPVYPIQSDQEKLSRELTVQLYRCCQIFTQITESTVSAGVSSFYINCGVFSYAYQEAKNKMITYEISEYYLNYKKSLTRQPIVFLDMVAQKLIYYYIKGSKTEQLRELLSQTLSKLFSNGTLTPSNAYQFVLEVIQFIQNILDETMDITLSYQPDMKKIIQADSPETCQMHLEDFLRKLEENSGAFSQQSIVRKLISYLQEHYSEDINLNDIAQNIFYTHPNYLSKVLKSSTGKSFSKYLLDIRMEKAKELLVQDENLSISIISQLVGFNSESYFVQTFKKYYGHTPGSFRRDI